MIKLLQILVLFLTITSLSLAQPVITEKQELLSHIDSELNDVQMELYWSEVLKAVPTEADMPVKEENFYFVDKKEYYTFNKDQIEEFLDSIDVYQDAFSPDLLLYIRHLKVNFTEPIEDYLEAKYTDTIQQKMLGYYKGGQYFNINERSLLDRQKIGNKYTPIVKQGLDIQLSPLEIIVSNLDSKYNFALLNTEPIDSLHIEYSTTLVNSHIFILNHKTTGEKVKLVDIDYDEAVIQYPEELKDRLMVEGVYKDGRYIRKGYTYSLDTIMSSQERKLLPVLEGVLNEAKEKVTNNEIVNSVQLEEFIYKKIPRLERARKKIYLEEKINFSAPIVGLRIRTDGEVHEDLTMNKVYPVKDKKTDYWISYDHGKGITRIIDKGGNFASTDTFQLNLQPEGMFYYYEDKGDFKQYYFLDRDLSTLNKVDYEVEDGTLWREGGFIKIIKDSKQGIANVYKNEVVLPTNNFEVQWVNGTTWKFKKNERDTYTSIDINKL